jgi:uncharacterized membrane protein YphA (DoxX/SURF4 family)
VTRAPERIATLARVLYGGVLAYMAVDAFARHDERVEHAAEQGVPVPELLVPLATGQLLVGSVGLALWRLPRLSAGAVAAFFALVTPVMDDFWNETGEARVEKRVGFTKNLVVLGGALAFLARAGRERRE